MNPFEQEVAHTREWLDGPRFEGITLYRLTQFENKSHIEWDT